VVVDYGVRYPEPMPNPPRLANGDVLTPTGAVLPFGASCPPGTSPDAASLTCLPFEGARNINYECGGMLASPTAAGCDNTVPAFAYMDTYVAPPVAMVEARPAWEHCTEETLLRADAGCNCGGGSNSHVDGKAVLVVFGLAVVFGLMRRRR
jgi:MYXO-CTERM domain-containing protein